jgi:hypothetical protein
MQPPSSLHLGNIELGKDSIGIIRIANTGDVTVNFSEYKMIPGNAITTEEEFRIVSAPT